MRIAAEGGDAEVAAGEFPSFVLDEEVELGRESRRVRGRRAKESPKGAVQAAEATVVDVVIFRVGDFLKLGFSAAVAR
ncbi:MAG TPA: hypothetical protein VGC56_04450 [Allosphingosinicella sp.]|jgi:hypothetical protein